MPDGTVRIHTDGTLRDGPPRPQWTNGGTLGLGAWGASGLEGANAGHKQQIVEKQAKVAGYASAMILQCLDPELKQLGEWYLYLATVILP